MYTVRIRFTDRVGQKHSQIFCTGTDDHMEAIENAFQKFGAGLDINERKQAATTLDVQARLGNAPEWGAE
jgi:hypothetical protein